MTAYPYIFPYCVSVPFLNPHDTSLAGMSSAVTPPKMPEGGQCRERGEAEKVLGEKHAALAGKGVGRYLVYANNMNLMFSTANRKCPTITPPNLP